MRRGLRNGTLLLAAASVLTFAAGALATRTADGHSPNMTLAFKSPTRFVNSDMAFWGKRAYVSNYGGFRIFDLSRPARPKLVASFRCFGPQGDPIVWGGKLLFLAVDRVLTGPECGSPEATNPSDPDGWEGVRIFDVSNPARPKFLKGVYTDCGAHTITLGPKVGNELRIYVSSYPLFPGPTCGPVRGPAVGRDPLHGVLQVLAVPLDDPAATKEIAEPKVGYPGDPDNRWNPAEHGLGQAPVNPLRACHDIGVFVELRLAAAACIEQAQLWKIDRNGIPDTAHPLWTYDDAEDTDGAGGGDVAVDFWHSATFSWDGRIVNFVDESVGHGCPPVTRINGVPSDTGRMFFLDVATGAKLSHFMIPRPEVAAVHCSAHVGNVVRTRDKKLLVNAWYAGGADVVDFTDPRKPAEIAWYDIARTGESPGSFNWSAYWYEGPRTGTGTLPIYGNDLEANPPSPFGFEVFLASVDVRRIGLGYLNPQTQERLLR